MEFEADTDGTLEDDVPVYEPAYPEHDGICSHQNCDNDCEPGERICEGCSPIMRETMPDECPLCGSIVGRESFK